MKKNLLFIAVVAAMVFSAVSCQKDALSEKANIKISGKTLDEIKVVRNSATRVGIDENLTPFFEKDDVIFGWDEEKSYAYKCTVASESEATFIRTSESAPSATEGTTVNLIYAPGYSEKDITDNVLVIDLSSQSGTLPVVMHAIGEVDAQGLCEVPFSNDVAIVEIIDAILPGAEENQEFTMSFEGSNTKINVSLTDFGFIGIDWNTPGTITNTVKVKANAEGKVSCKFAVPASSDSVNVILKAAGSKNYVLDFGKKKISAGKYIKATGKTFAEDASAITGALPGEFAVSASGKVRFAQGNLFWDGDSFEFEENQYTIGTWNAENHVNYFFWSNDATIAEAASYADASAAASDVFFTNASEFTVGGETGFRTLSADEWTYLLATRTNAADLLAEGVTVCGVENCLVIAPDTCLNEYEFDKTKKSYDAAAWATAEAAGLVCLPPAGFRDGATVKSDDGNGFYWTSTTGNAESASNLGFKKSDN